MTQDILLSQRGETAALIRSIDWTKTPLGQPDTWPASLVTILRLMLSSRYSMWLGWGKDLTFFYNDAYAAETLGPKHPSAMGKPFRDVWPEIADTLTPRVEHVLRTGEATWDAGLLLFLERSGKPEETYHTFSYSPAPADEAGQIGGLFCVVVEETERVIGERRLAALQELSSAFGRTKTEADVYAALERCLGAHGRDLPFTLTYAFDAREGVARRTSLTNIEADHPAAAATLSLEAPTRWRLDALRASGETQLVSLDGDVAWPRGPWHLPPTQALIIPIAYQGQGGPAGALIAAVNPLRPFDANTRSFMELLAGQASAALSSARAYEEERKRADALADIDRAKTTFFSNVSHEFRTPLTLMLGPTEDALASPERALRGADLETVHRNELRLLKLVNSLLDFARIEAGRVQATYTPTDLATLTVDLASSFRSAIDRAGLAFVVESDPLPEAAFVDHDMWEKIVLNLLSNALKFTFDGEIAVKLAWAGDHFELTVRDTGVGIAAEELPRLFERFHRVEGARSRTHEGSGIGLALVAELVRLHGGELRVESALGQGTTFRISLPRGSSHLPQERIGAARPLEPSASGAAYVAEAMRWMGKAPSKDEGPAAAAKGPDGDRARVLVADDNADMREYVVRLLGERWDVEAVSDGRAALASVHRNPPDLVLSDVMMPELDGLGLLRALRADPALRSIPVILLSARAGEEASVGGLDAGADDYIVKPFAARDLVMRVASKLAAVRAAREVGALKENLYRHFMQAPFPVAIFRGENHEVELANNACLAAWGRTREQALGRPLAEAIPSLWSQPFGGYLDGVFRSGITYEGLGERFERPTADGKTEHAYFTFVYAPLKGASGVTEGILMSAFDVTPQVLAHREAERARDEAQRLAAELAVSSYRLRASQQVAGIGIFDWDISTDETYWSPELYHLLGIEPGSVRPSPEAWTARLFDETDREAGWKAFEHATAAREPKMEVEVRLRQPDNRFRWIRLSTELHYDDDKPIRLLGAVVDVQVHKEAAAARARALEEAERTSRAKDEFLATMSHELRTPLNAMLGWATILRGGPMAPDRVSHGLAVIERNARTQARLVDDLLDVSRIISGKLRLSAETVSIAAVVHAAVDVVRPAADAKGIRLSVDADAALGVIVGDPDRLQQIVWNLVANAVKFTPPEGRVHVALRRIADAMSVRVEDSGAGVSPEDLPYIFDRFKQVDSSMTRAHGGLGLGLAIVRHLVEAHGGSVQAESAGQGRGSTFTVLLPARATFVGERAEQAAEPPLPPAVTPERMLAGATVLVVDDDGDSRDLVRTVLENAGASVLVAASAAAGLQELSRRPVDVLVSDIGMPEMDGYGFIGAVRAAQPGLPALALTAYARREDAEQARRAGFQEHVAKPFDGVNLVSSVARLLVKA